MPWKVFGFIALLIVVTAFTAFNLENRSDVSIGVYVFNAVPVFLTSLISFTLGAALVVPLIVPRRVARRAPGAVPQLTDESDAVATAPPRVDDAAAAAPELPAEPKDEESVERAPAPAGRKARRRFGKRRRDEEQD